MLMFVCKVRFTCKFVSLKHRWHKWLTLDLLFKERVQEPTRHRHVRRSSDTTCKQAGEHRGGPIALWIVSRSFGMYAYTLERGERSLLWLAHAVQDSVASHLHSCFSTAMLTKNDRGYPHTHHTVRETHTKQKKLLFDHIKKMWERKFFSSIL